MNATNDGGPAFPVPDLHPGAMQVGSSGMPLRDWFAGQEVLEDECADLPTATMEALAGRPYPGVSGPRTTAQDRLDVLAWNADWRAKLKYIRADAMLRARERVALEGGAR